ncbi:MAG: hypothetical protein A2W25_05915 [candidate division Zixibacteria bacterium RBG_16_53_22]|nr:MAG: hypothetical protein A2W25_05915 [candidate division Zixibacteria bacterium RBG_16_53_22]
MSKYNRQEQGSMLVMAVVFSFIVILLGVAYLSFAINLHNSISGNIGDHKALYNALGATRIGVENHLSGHRQYGYQLFYRDRENRRNTDWFYPEIITGNQEDINYGTRNYVTILGYGKSDYEGQEKTRKAAIQFGYETYADYLYLSHRERDTIRHDDIRFWTPDTLDGKVHSNDTIRIEQFSDRPVFKKRVTTTMNYIDPPNNHARFDEGWGYRNPIYFPNQAQILRDNCGLWLGTAGTDSLIHIVLDGDLIRWRRCGIRNVNGADSIACLPTTISDMSVLTHPRSGVVFVIGKLWISSSRGRGDIMDGEFPERIPMHPGAYITQGFEGQLTIGSSDTMIITDNLVYKRSRPATGPFPYSVPPTMDSCSDVLGLVSEKCIMIHRQVRDTVYINAAMAAVSGSISVQDIYWHVTPNTHPSNRNPKVSLQIYGSLAQRNRGIVHTTWPCGEPYCERGFDEKDYHYDVRLKDYPPPYYLPTLDQEIIYMQVAQDDGGG